MKTIFSTLLVLLAVVSLQAQAPAPAAGKTILQQLQEIKANNARLIDHQAATLKRLEELEKTSQSLKMLGRRG